MPNQLRVSARSRVAACAGAGLAAFGVAMALTPWQGATLVGWDIMAVAWVGWVGLSVLGKERAVPDAWPLPRTTPERPLMRC